MNIKFILKEILPPFFWQWLSKKVKKNKQDKKKYDPRRWWYGEDLIGDSSRFKEVFKLDHCETCVSMLNNEIRDCIKIEPKKSLKLKFNNFNYKRNVLFSFGNKSDQRSIEGNYQLVLDEKIEIEIKDPLSNRWNNSCLKEVLNCHELEIKNNTNSSLYFACPVFLENFDDTKQKNIKNVFLIILDQVDYKIFNEIEKNPDSLTYIKKFFKNGINYENCFSAAEWTLPCFSSIFSGKHPSIHGNFDLKYSKKIKNVITDDNLIDFLRKNGFSTFGISRSKGHHAGYNFQKYFDRLLYYDDAVDLTIEDEYIFAKKAQEQLEMNKDGKNFIFMHYMSTHSPYWKPSINEEINLGNIRYGDSQKEYDDSIVEFGDSKAEPIMDNKKLKNIIIRQIERIKNLDLVLGQLFSYLEETKLKENSLIIMSADHGPNHFGEKNLSMMNRPRLNIPMKIYDFQNLNSKNIEDYVCQTDIYPLIKSLVLNKNSSNLIAPYGKKNDPVISESIFNDKYKASIRSKEHTFYFSCKFDPENSNILYNEVLENRLEYNSSNNEDDKEVKKFYFTILLEHLKKSNILKIIEK